jgi:hypothetical protein
MVLRDCSSALWLQLRFGGELHGVTLQPDWLARMAMALPPAAPRRPPHCPGAQLAAAEPHQAGGVALAALTSSRRASLPSKPMVSRAC